MNSPKNQESNPDEKELEQSIIKLSESLGKNDIVSEIFLEELLNLLLPKSYKKKS
jgi:hypothetical protein